MVTQHLLDLEREVTLKLWKDHICSKPDRHLSSMLELGDAQFLAQISFLLQLFQFPCPQATTNSIWSQTSGKVCHKEAWTDMPYPSSDNLWCRVLCKGRLRSANTFLKLWALLQSTAAGFGVVHLAEHTGPADTRHSCSPWRAQSCSGSPLHQQTASLPGTQEETQKRTGGHQSGT